MVDRTTAESRLPTFGYKAKNIDLNSLIRTTIPSGADLFKRICDAKLGIVERDGFYGVLGIGESRDVHPITNFLSDFIGSIQGKELDGLQVLTAWDSARGRLLPTTLHSTMDILWFDRIIDTILPNEKVGEEAKNLRIKRQ